MFLQVSCNVGCPACGGELTTLQTRVSVRVQAIITELVFEHALRIRMKAETNDPVETNEGGENAVVATPDTTSQIEGNRQDKSSEGSQAGASAPVNSATSGSGTASPSPSASATDKGKSKAAPENTSKTAAEETKPVTDKKKAKNLVGRINNLVTSDLSNLGPIGMLVTVARTSTVSPRDVSFRLIGLYSVRISSPDHPLHGFLVSASRVEVHTYSFWCLDQLALQTDNPSDSALVGLATMLITLPVPGWITKLIQGSQREKMQRVSVNAVRPVDQFSLRHA